ncbi:hypothetical protein AGMMS49592_3110 [Endomicrobiia bacterium]|nr:hypothetical protein AGMMS49592_3110 [Endomicrobiia bacterium]
MGIVYIVRNPYITVTERQTGFFLYPRVFSKCKNGYGRLCKVCWDLLLKNLFLGIIVELF